MTVRIKKIEKINGVEKVTDTSYTVTDEQSARLILKPQEVDGFRMPEQGYSFSIDSGDETKGEAITIRQFGKEETEDIDKMMVWIDSELEKGLVKPGKESDEVMAENMIFIQSEGSDQNNSNQKTSPKKVQKVIIIRKVHVTDPSKEELKSIGQTDGAGTNSLKPKTLEFAPNPSNGITGLTLEIATKGPTDITIYNLNGQVIYKEDLGDFTGRCFREIDLSGSPKGIYFFKVTQNNESLSKKLILE